MMLPLASALPLAAAMRNEKPPAHRPGVFREGEPDQAWLGFFIFLLLVFFFATFFVVLAFFAAFFFGVVCSVCACAFVIIGMVDAATNESRANAVMSAFMNELLGCAGISCTALGVAMSD
jgi:hypothetical protein